MFQLRHFVCSYEGSRHLRFCCAAECQLYFIVYRVCARFHERNEMMMMMKSINHGELRAAAGGSAVGGWTCHPVHCPCQYQ